MNKKNLIIVLILTVILGYFYFNEKNNQLKQQLVDSRQAQTQTQAQTQPQAQAQTQTQPQNQSNNSKKSIINNENTGQQGKYKTQQQTLETMSAQLIESREQVQFLQKKLLLSSSKKTVLIDEIKQNTQAKRTIKKLKTSIDTVQKTLSNTRKKLQSSKQNLAKVESKLNTLQTHQVTQGDREKINQLNSIITIFKQKNKDSVNNNIRRINKLKEASSGVLVTGAIVPIIGAATLVSYTLEEIDNYCENIKNTLALERSIFGKVISLDKEVEQAYQQSCVLSFKEKTLENVKNLSNTI